MTTDELKALLRECREYAAKRHFHYGVIKNGEKVENIECSGGVCELFTKIDAALASDFAVVSPEVLLNAKRYEWLRLKHDDGDGSWFVYGAQDNLNESLDKAMLAASEGK
jgi:hypothetical protein